MDVRLARTAVPVTLPLDGIRASDIQQRIDRAESLAASGDLDGGDRDVAATFWPASPHSPLCTCNWPRYTSASRSLNAPSPNTNSC